MFLITRNLLASSSQKVEKGSNMVFIQDIVRGTELTIASGGPPGGLPAATAQAPSD
jgi:hypothetical protein